MTYNCKFSQKNTIYQKLKAKLINNLTKLADCFYLKFFY